jgi:hypothetical protein
MRRIALVLLVAGPMACSGEGLKGVRCEDVASAQVGPAEETPAGAPQDVLAGFSDRPITVRVEVGPSAGSSLPATVSIQKLAAPATFVTRKDVNGDNVCGGRLDLPAALTLFTDDGEFNEVFTGSVHSYERTTRVDFEGTLLAAEWRGTLDASAVLSNYPAPLYSLVTDLEPGTAGTLNLKNSGPADDRTTALIATWDER